MSIERDILKWALTNGVWVLIREGGKMTLEAHDGACDSPITCPSSEWVPVLEQMYGCTYVGEVGT